MAKAKQKNLLCDVAAISPGGPVKSAKHYHNLWKTDGTRYATFYCGPHCKVPLKAAAVYRATSALVAHFKILDASHPHLDGCAYIKERQKGIGGSSTNTGVQTALQPASIYIEGDDGAGVQKRPRRGTTGAKSPMTQSGRGSLTSIVESYLGLIDKHSSTDTYNKKTITNLSNLQSELEAFPLSLLGESLNYYSAFQQTRNPHPKGAGSRIYHSIGKVHVRPNSGDFFFYCRERVTSAKVASQLPAYFLIPKTLCERALATNKYAETARALENAAKEGSEFQWFCVGILAENEPSAELDGYQITLEKLQRLRLFET